LKPVCAGALETEGLDHFSPPSPRFSAESYRKCRIDFEERAKSFGVGLLIEGGADPDGVKKAADSTYSFETSRFGHRSPFLHKRQVREILEIVREEGLFRTLARC
jgi:hypothetical protein